jgi:hypothetical protein
VIHVHLVVQRQRVVALAPAVADARPAIDDQRVDLELREPRGDREPGLAAADHEHGRIAVRILRRGSPQVEPVRSAEVARVRLALGARPPDHFLDSVQLVERGEQRPRSRCVAVRFRKQADDAAAATLHGLEAEDRFDRFCAGARHFARLGSLRIHAKAGGLSRLRNGVAVPRQRRCGR